MKPIRTPDSNVVFTLPGDDTGDRDLHAQRVMVYDTDLGQTIADARVAHITLWQPDDAESQRLDAGAVVEIRIDGSAYPPISVGVTNAALPEREIIARGDVERAVGHLYGVLQARLDKAALELADAVEESESETAAADMIRIPVDHGHGWSMMGLPDPSTFADLWAESVKATQTAG